MSEITETQVNINVSSQNLDKYMKISINFCCKECGYSTDDKKIFYDHCLKHYIRDQIFEESPTVYSCSECYKVFNTFQETKRHLKQEHSRNAVKNVEKAGKVETKVKYKTKSKGEWSCLHSGCKVSFDKESDLEIHTKCHLDSGLKMFSCSECSVLLPTWPKCAVHLFKEHGIDCGLLKCALCESYRTWYPLTLENHMRVHSDLRAFFCKTCGQSFKQASQLRNHNATHAHVETLTSKRKQCTMCFKLYSDAKALKKHKEEVHSRLRPFVCNVCGHASARKCLLALHQRQHTGHKAYKCTFCEYATADHNSLRRHLMRHTGVRAYYCPECSFSAARSSSFKLHVKQKHPNSVHFYSCLCCPYKTVSEDNYTRHVSDHLTGLIKDENGEMEGKNFEELALQFPAWIKKGSTSATTETRITDIEPVVSEPKTVTDSFVHHKS